MQLDSSFAVTAPIDQVWRTLMDFEAVAGCVPGAQVLSKLSDDAYQVGMTVKLGPVTMTYKGQMEVVERDEAGHRAVLKGQAKEARGQGTAQATATLQLVEDAGTTRGSVSADVALSGRAAAMGQGVIGKVTDQMMEQFAQNLQAVVSSSPADGGATAAGVEALSEDGRQAVDGPVPATSAPASPAVTPSAEPVAGRPTAPAPDDSLDALALARGVLEEQLRDPRRVLTVLAVVALVAYKLGQRATRRERARWTGEH